MNIRLLTAGAVFSLALAACGSGGSSTVPATHGSGGTTAPTAPNNSTGGGGSAASAQRSTMTISITVPPKKHASSSARTVKTISPNAAYLNVVLQSLNGTPQPVNGPYNLLVPLSQFGACANGNAGRDHARSTQSLAQCLTTDLTAPVGDAVYALGVLDANMTLLDYADNVPVTVASGATATLSATLNGVGASVIGYSMLTDPNAVTPYQILNAVGCPPDAVAVDPQAICSFVFDAADNSGDDMWTGTSPSSPSHLANALALTATDLTTQQPLALGYGGVPADPASAIQQVVYDPNAQAGMSGNAIDPGPIPYNAVLHWDLSAIPSGATHTVELTAVLQPPVTTAFGPNVSLPHQGPATFTWDIPCRTVTVGAGDPSGVAEGTVLHFCDPPSNLHVVVQ